MQWDDRWVNRSWHYAWVPTSASRPIHLRRSNNFIWWHLMHRLVNVFESCPVAVIVVVATHSWDWYRSVSCQRLLLILLRQAWHFARRVSFRLKMCNARFLFQLSVLCPTNRHFFNGTLVWRWHIVHVMSPCHRVLATMSWIASRSHYFRSVQLLLAGLCAWLASCFSLAGRLELNLVGQCIGSIAFQHGWHAWSYLLDLVILCSFGLRTGAFMNMLGLRWVWEFGTQSLTMVFLTRFMSSRRH